MSATLAIESFGKSNLRERSQLLEGVNAGESVIKLLSTADYAPGDILYVGTLSLECCERAVIASVDSAQQITLTNQIKFDHGAYDPVCSVLGDTIRIYRAPADGNNPPAEGMYVALAARSIDSEQLSTYYRDPAGSADFWYRFTYTNLTSGAETSLAASRAVRGQAFGAYCSLREIREEASALNARSLPDTTVEQCRTNAQSEINAALKNVYGAKVPFAPVPDLIRTLTIQLAAGLLYQVRYPGRESLWEGRLKDARTVLKQLQTRDVVIGGDDGSTLATGRLSFYPDVTAPRAFKRGMRF